ncbi:MAG: hypothetical protein HZA20_12255 [Nitrospirae bacterium]|nr:hypothetical protein [Nitrospirota bacterium]
MSGHAAAEGIFCKKSRQRLGTGITSKTCTVETLWLPYAYGEDYVDLMLVADSLDNVLNLKERVPIERFNVEYEIKEDSVDAFRRLRQTVGG